MQTPIHDSPFCQLPTELVDKILVHSATGERHRNTRYFISLLLLSKSTHTFLTRVLYHSIAINTPVQLNRIANLAALGDKSPLRHTRHLWLGVSIRNRSLIGLSGETETFSSAQSVAVERLMGFFVLRLTRLYAPSPRLLNFHPIPPSNSDSQSGSKRSMELAVTLPNLIIHLETQHFLEHVDSLHLLEHSDLPLSIFSTHNIFTPFPHHKSQNVTRASYHINNLSLDGLRSSSFAPAIAGVVALFPSLQLFVLRVVLSKPGDLNRGDTCWLTAVRHELGVLKTTQPGLRVVVLVSEVDRKAEEDGLLWREFCREEGAQGKEDDVWAVAAQEKEREEFESGRWHGWRI